MPSGKLFFAAMHLLHYGGVAFIQEVFYKLNHISCERVYTKLL